MPFDRATAPIAEIMDVERSSQHNVVSIVFVLMPVNRSIGLIGNHTCL